MSKKLECMWKKSKSGYISSFEFLMEMFADVYKYLFSVLFPPLINSKGEFITIVFLSNFSIILILELFIIPENFAKNLSILWKLVYLVPLLEFAWIPLVLLPIQNAFYECYCEVKE